MNAKKDFIDFEYIVNQKAINDILVNNKVFSNELIFNYVLSRDIGAVNQDDLDKKVTHTLLSCGIKDHSLADCKNHLDVLRKSFSTEENRLLTSAYSKDKDYSINLLSDGAVEILEVDYKYKETLQKEIDTNSKNLGIVSGGFLANFLHNWKVSGKLATLYLEKLTTNKVQGKIIHQSDIKVDELEKFVLKLNMAFESIDDRQYIFDTGDIKKLNTLGVNYKDITNNDWLKLSKGEVAGPVDMVIGGISSVVFLQMKDDQIGCYHLNDISKKETIEVSKSPLATTNTLLDDKNSKQLIGNYLYNNFGIVTIGFTNDDFNLLKSGQLPSVIMRSPNQDVFGNQDMNNRMGKVSLQFDGNGNIIGHELFPRAEKLVINDFFKGNFLNPNEKESLQKIGEFEQAVYLNIDDRKNVKGFLSVDHSLNQVVFLEADKINIPSKINGNEILDRYKVDLLEGKSVIFYDFRHDGEDIDAMVKLNKLTGQLEVEKISDYVDRINKQESESIDQKEVAKILEIPEIFMGYEFSSKDLKDLEQKDGLKDAVEVEKDGELVVGFISVDKEKQEVVFLAKSDILIDKSALLGNELSKEQRQMLVNGYSVVYPDFVNEGNKSTVKIEINRLDGSTKVSPVVSGLSLMESKIEKEKANKLALEESKKESKAPKIN